MVCVCTFFTTQLKTKMTMHILVSSLFVGKVCRLLDLYNFDCVGNLMNPNCDFEVYLTVPKGVGGGEIVSGSGSHIRPPLHIKVKAIQI